MKYKYLKLKLEEELHRQLKTHAAKAGSTMQDEIIKAVKTFLASQQQED